MEAEKKGLLDEFIAYLEEQVKNHSIYVWGAQGQGEDKISEEFIKNRETSEKNSKRAIKFWKKQVEAGYGSVLKAFDCSGLIVYWLKDIKKIFENDMTANGLMGRCRPVLKAQLEKGDWVFRVNDSGRATHVGIVADESLNVIEAYGRDRGVIKRGLNEGGASYWNGFGRPEVFTDEITESKPEGQYIFSRIMKKTSPLMRGEDIKRLQQLIKAAGFSPGSIDGVYGKNTKSAVKLFQKANALKADGIAGRNTVAMLGQIWTQ